MLTYESKLPMIPLRPTAVAAQDDMGIQVWVIGPSQAVPANYKSLVINEALIDWLSGADVRRRHAAGGRRRPVRPRRQQAEQLRRGRDRCRRRSRRSRLRHRARRARQPVQRQGLVVAGRPASSRRSRASSYADGIDAIVAANGDLRRLGRLEGRHRRARPRCRTGVTIDEFVRDPDPYRGVAKVDTEQVLSAARRERDQARRRHGRAALPGRRTSRASTAR